MDQNSFDIIIILVKIIAIIIPKFIIIVITIIAVIIIIIKPNLYPYYVAKIGLNLLGSFRTFGLKK